MNKIYDIIVIGAGSGGLNIAVFMARIGCTVLLIDKSDRSIGGDCLNYGCIPSKALIHVARMVYTGKNVSQFGITQQGEVDIEKVMAYVTERKEIIREHENAAHFRNLGIDVVLGTATFASANEVEVDNTKYTGKKIVIATGSRPRTLTIPGASEAFALGILHTNETIFDLKVLPKKLVVIGAGPIGVELGQALSHLGSEVTLVSNDSHILPREDTSVVNVLFEQLQRDGMHFVFNTNTVRIQKSTLILKDRNTDAENSLPFDVILVAIGRILNTDNLQLEKAGVEIRDGKIVVDAYLRTTNKNIYVCGDVAGMHQFTHAAELHAGLLLRNFFTPFFKKKLSTKNMSWVTYATPEIATYGLSEKELLAQHIPYTILEESFEHDDRAITDSATHGIAKMFVNPKSGRILGGTMVAPHAGELIQELILSMSAKIPISKIFNKTYPYPTASRINKRVVTGYFKEKLTVRAASILKTLFRLFA